MQIQIPYKKALRGHQGSKHPRKVDNRVRDGAIFPFFTPKFQLDLTQPVFTLGSCFARNVEEVLCDRGVSLPTMSFLAPKSEWDHRSNGLLNEYNPGTMSQRIRSAVSASVLSADTIVAADEGYSDLLLHGGANVTLERAIARRAEIDAVYQQMPTSGCLIITLGFVEAWFDQLTQLYLNRVPPPSVGRKEPNRFVLRRLAPGKVYELLESAISQLTNLKIVITVSPVPIQRTFTTDDCVTANEYSKAVLRICADRLAAKFRNVDYFPSYEIVRSGGISSYSDGVHVHDNLVRRVVAYMLELYCPTFSSLGVVNQ